MNDGTFQSKSGAVEISLEPEFKGISSLLADITKYRIINEKDGLAAMKISRALFQAFLKYRLTESKARELNNEEEATLKRVLSYLIEVEEGRIPHLNLSDRSKKASKYVQTEPEKHIDHRSRYSNEASSHFEKEMGRRYDSSAGVNLDAPRDDYFFNHRGRPQARSRSPSPMAINKRMSSPSWRTHDERTESWTKMRREDTFSPKTEDYYSRQMREREKERLADIRKQSPVPRELEPLSFGDRPFDPASGRRGMTQKIDDVKSVKIIDGCKVTRLVRVKKGDFSRQSRGRGAPVDYMSEIVHPESRHSTNDSFSMKVKTAPTLSQARNVAVTKLGLYTDLAKSAYRK